MAFFILCSGLYLWFIIKVRIPPRCAWKPAYLPFWSYRLTADCLGGRQTSYGNDIANSMLRISWVDKITNEDVLRKAEMHREILQHIRKRKMTFLGHVYRKDYLESRVLTGRIQGKKDRGQQRLKYLRSLYNWTTIGTKSKT